VKSSVISPVLSPSKGPSEVLGETRATTVRRVHSRAASFSVDAIAEARSFPRWHGQSRLRSLAGDRGGEVSRVARPRAGERMQTCSEERTTSSVQLPHTLHHMRNAVREMYTLFLPSAPTWPLAVSRACSIHGTCICGAPTAGSAAVYRRAADAVACGSAP
jgi:hypothetical protein